MLTKNGQPRDLYIWTVNVHNATGASAFDIRVYWDTNMMAMTGMEWFDTWIGSTNRNPACISGVGPNVGLDLDPGEAFSSCNTFNIPPPFGATGTGKLTRISLAGGSNLGLATIDLTESFLVDTPSNPEDEAPIPASVPLVYVTIAKCADFDLNGTIDLFNDIFGVALRFGMSQGQQGWNPIYDLDDNGVIDLFNDIFFSAFQFGGSC